MSLRKSRHFAGSAAFALLLVLLSVFGCKKTETQPGPEAEQVPRDQKPDAAAEVAPNPELTPAEVVKLQLESIRDSQGAERGLASAYRFTSAYHNTGSVTFEQFASMIRHSEFETMLDYRAADYGKVQFIDDDKAQQIVMLHGNDGRIQMFLFDLSRKQGGPDKGCWLTDAFYPGQIDLSLPDAETGNNS